LEEAAEQFKAFKKLKGVADRTYGEYQLHFNDVIKHFGKDFETGKLTTEAAATYLARWQSNLLSYSHHRRTMAALWSWLAKAKKVDGNPLLGIPNPNNNNRLAYAKKPSHYHLKEVRVLLKAAPRKLLPFLALALFSGMRTEEIARLQQDGAWEKINLRTLRIQVRGKRGPRDVLIKQPLAAWLRKFEARKPAFWTPSHWIWFRELKRSELDAKRARIPNLLRHTYCTYALNAKGASYAEVSRQAGNSEAMLKRHYEGNATQEDAATFFLITPRVAGL
jgi:integrase